MKVLVTEDDPALAGFLRKSLMIEGYAVDLAITAKASAEQIEARSYDLLLLDLNLPDSDGTELLRRLQGVKAAPSVIVLTGRTQVEERIRCLDLGADDYLSKPFSFGELIARCRASLRRRERKLVPELRAGQLAMDRFSRSVAWAGTPVELTPKEFALLECLLLSDGHCCTREDLLQQVWPDLADSGSNVVDVYVNYLRRKLAAAAAAHSSPGQAAGSMIQTVRGSGYRLTQLDEASRFLLSA